MSYFNHFNIVLKVLTRQENEVKGIKIGKKEVKLSVCTDDIILHRETTRNPENYSN